VLKSGFLSLKMSELYQTKTELLSCFQAQKSSIKFKQCLQIQYIQRNSPDKNNIKVIKSSKFDQIRLKCQNKT
jgi:hypothetical protein